MVTTSSTPRRSLSRVGPSMNSAPAAALAARSSGSRSGRRQRDRAGAQGHRGDGAQIELALGADVPQPGAEGHGDGEAGEDQGRGAGQRLAEREPGAEAGHRHLPVGAGEVGAGERAAAPRPAPGPPRSPAAGAAGLQPGRRMGAGLKPHAAACPVISRPSSRTVTPEVGMRGAQPAAMHDGDPVGKAQELVQVLGDQDDGRHRGGARRAGGHGRRPPHRRRGRGSAGRPGSGAGRAPARGRAAASGCCRRRAGRPAGPAPRSARRRPRSGARACCGQPAAAQEAQALAGRAAAGLEHEVLGRSAGRRRRPRRGGPPGCGRRRRATTAAGPPAGQGWPTEPHLAGASAGARPASRPASARWPLPETPAMPTISWAWTVRSTPAMPAPPRPGTVDAAQLEDRPARLLGVAPAAGCTGRPTIASAIAAGLVPRDRELGHLAAGAQHGDAPAQRASPRRACG